MNPVTKRAAVEAFNADFAKRAAELDRARGMATYRALLWRDWRLEHDRKAILDKDPRGILKSQLVRFRPHVEEKSEPADGAEEARDMATVLATGDYDEDDAAQEEREVRETAKRFAFRYHQRCRGRGYLVKAERAVICKCAARKMRLYIEANQ